MTEYVRIYEATNSDEVSAYVRKGWVLINTLNSIHHEDDEDIVKFVLGLSAKEYTNRLLAIIRKYEEHGLKETLFEKVAETEDEGGPASSLRQFMVEYEVVVNNDKKL